MKGLYYASLPYALRDLVSDTTRPADLLNAAAEVSLVTESLAYAILRVTEWGEENLSRDSGGRADHYDHLSTLSITLMQLAGANAEALGTEAIRRGATGNVGPDADH